MFIIYLSISKPFNSKPFIALKKNSSRNISYSRHLHGMRLLPCLKCMSTKNRNSKTNYRKSKRGTSLTFSNMKVVMVTTVFLDVLDQSLQAHGFCGLNIAFNSFDQLMNNPRKVNSKSTKKYQQTV